MGWGMRGLESLVLESRNRTHTYRGLGVSVDRLVFEALNAVYCRGRKKARCFMTTSLTRRYGPVGAACEVQPDRTVGFRVSRAIQGWPPRRTRHSLQFEGICPVFTLLFLPRSNAAPQQHLIYKDAEEDGPNSRQSS